MNATVTLHCELGAHDWQRQSQRGRKPRNCPEHTPVKPPDMRRRPTGNDSTADYAAVTQAVSTAPAPVDDETIDFYCELGDWPQSERHLVARLVAAGIEPPTREAVSWRGFTVKESDAIHSN